MLSKQCGVCHQVDAFKISNAVPLRTHETCANCQTRNISYIFNNFSLFLVACRCEFINFSRLCMFVYTPLGVDKPYIRPHHYSFFPK